MRYAVVVPFVYKPYYEEFIKTYMLPEDNTLIIDNSPTGQGNLGIMRSHNMGIRFMRDIGAEWLIVMSAGIRFGTPGGRDFIAALDKHPDALLLHGSGMWVDPGTKKEVRQVLGWHLTAFRSEIFDKIGGWDNNFSPYGLDDTDLTLRMQKGFGDRYKLEITDVDMRHESTSHSISLANVKSAYAPRNAYFKRKWGREGGDWQNEGYPTPFNDPAKPLSYCPEPDDPNSIWQVEYKTGGYKFDE